VAEPPCARPTKFADGVLLYVKKVPPGLTVGEAGVETLARGEAL
jgi:hypothetical protein